MQLMLFGSRVLQKLSYGIEQCSKEFLLRLAARSWLSFALGDGADE